MEITFGCSSAKDFVLTLSTGDLTAEYHFPPSSRLTMEKIESNDGYNLFVLRWRTGNLRLCTRGQTQFTVTSNTHANELADDMFEYQRIVVSTEIALKIVDVIQKSYPVAAAAAKAYWCTP